MNTKSKIEAAMPVQTPTQKQADKSYVTALMPTERTPSALQLKLIADLPLQLKPVFDRLYELFDQQTRSILIDVYQAGLIVKSCKDGDIVLYKPLRSTTSLGALAHALGVSIRTLHDARKLVETFTVEEYGELIKQQPISWSHIRELLSVVSRAQRQELIQRVIDDNLSVDELVSLIVEKYQGVKKSRGPGRNPKPPLSVAHGLRKTVQISNSYCNVCDKALFSDAFDLPTRILDTAPDMRTVAMGTEIQAAISALEKVAAAANEKAEALRKVLPLCTYGFEASHAEPEHTVIPTSPLRAVPQPLPQKS